MQTIGVTGGTGFIGQYLLRENKNDYRFIVLTSGKSRKTLVESPNIKYVKGEYTESSLKEVFDGCDAIVHLGAKRSDPENEKALSNYLDNISFTECLFRAARDIGITNVVNISSTGVYSGSLKAPFSEKMAVEPINFYGVSKRTTELCALLYNKRFNMCIKSLRLAQVIGEGERGGYILTVFKERCRDGLPLMVYGEGKSGKEYIYVKDVVRAIIAALQHPEKNGVYNIGTGVFTSNRLLAETYCNVFDNKAGYQLLTEKPEIVSEYYMDVKFASSEFGFTCAYDLKSAIEDMKIEMEKAENE